jgi:acyl transferase domain-containing protein
MATELYGRDELFTAAADAFFQAYGPDAPALREAWFGRGDAADIHRGPFAQPLLMMVGYACAVSLVEHVGVKPAVIGHSIGEWAAACLARVFTLETGARLVAERARLLSQSAPGGMLAVAASVEDVQDLVDSFPDSVAVGAVNAPQQVVLSAPEPLLTSVLAQARARGWSCMRVKAHEPFHSPVLGAMADQLTDMLPATALAGPRLPLISSWSADQLSTAQARTPAFWTRQVAGCIRFWEALTRLDRPNTLFVESGPGSGLSAIAKQLSSVRGGTSRVITPVPSGRAAGWSSWSKARDCMLQALEH